MNYPAREIRDRKVLWSYLRTSFILSRLSPTWYWFFYGCFICICYKEVSLPSENSLEAIIGFSEHLSSSLFQWINGIKSVYLVICTPSLAQKTINLILIPEYVYLYKINDPIQINIRKQYLQISSYQQLPKNVGFFLLWPVVPAQHAWCPSPLQASSYSQQTQKWFQFLQSKIIINNTPFHSEKWPVLIMYFMITYETLISWYIILQSIC